MGSALEVYPVPHIYPVRRPFEGLNDAQRLASDWYRVGLALYSAMSVAAVETSREQEEQEAIQTR
jgi:hypothetical protein